MNPAGSDYLKEVRHRWSQVREKPASTRSEITGRTMRLGIEARAYELIPEEYEMFALATLKDDYSKIRFVDDDYSKIN